MKIEIRNRWTGSIIFECEAGSPKLAVEQAVRTRVSLRDSNLSGSNLRGSLDGVPTINNIHQAVYQAASQPNALDMSSWHTCETTHCRAGWVITLAGEAGKAMEFCIGASAAAALIYIASDPQLETVPDFHASNKTAIEDMKKRAEAEAARA